MNSSRRTELTQRLLGQDITAGQMAELRRELAADPAFASELRQQVAVDTFLRVRYGDMKTTAQWDSVLDEIEGRFVRSAPESAPAPALRMPAWVRLGIPLAAAASILAVGVWFVRPGDSAPFRITKQTGPVTVKESLIETGVGSACRVELRDGTVVVMDQNTRLDLGVLEPGEVGRTFRQEAGRIYAEVAPQKQPLSIRCGDGEVRVLGTRFEIERQGEKATLQLFEGAVKVTHGDSGTYLGPGQASLLTKVARSFQNITLVDPRGLTQPEGRRLEEVRSIAGARLIEVAPGEATVATLAWTRAMGVDAAGVVGAMAGVVQPGAGGAVDYGRYLVFDGMWKIQPAGRDVSVIQESMSNSAQLHLGQARWKRGTFSFSFKILQAGREMPAVGVSLFDGRGGHCTFTSRRGLQELFAQGYRETFRMKFDFDVTPEPNRQAVLRNWALWPDGALNKAIRAPAWSLDAASLKSGAYGVGFATDLCAVEFSEIRLENGVE